MYVHNIEFAVIRFTKKKEFNIFTIHDSVWGGKFERVYINKNVHAQV